VLETERLRLTAWSLEDSEALVEINAHPEVTRYLRPADRDESLRQAAYFAGHWDEHGFGLWALRDRDDPDGPVLGFTGLSIPRHFPAVLPAVEVGWRLRRTAWGCGYATEAARPALAHGFGGLGLEEIISLIHEDNARSLAVARRMGLRERERIGVVRVFATTRSGAARRFRLARPAGRRPRRT
jgi:RimJ/RimL family protein N-acetyltransferase